MALWTAIRDFFVQHCFGGWLSNGTGVQCFFGQGHSTNGYEQLKTTTPMFAIGGESATLYISLGDWLSTTATIITLVGIVVCAFLFIRWIFKVCSNSILLR